MEKQPISTAPIDGTTILAWWQGDPDPNPETVRYNSNLQTWVILGIDLAGPCITPTHWSPL